MAGVVVVARHKLVCVAVVGRYKREGWWVRGRWVGGRRVGADLAGNLYGEKSS